MKTEQELLDEMNKRLEISHGIQVYRDARLVEYYAKRRLEMIEAEPLTIKKARLL